ncbi:hypothetical protein KEH51_02380 [[Brevibacterium] frigoritolerans]|uniref:Uncharacterized protein n=1 Tax=Peribacillus frigoritolerans TaxID=450367 RepID=A0A941FJL9_9BACI|nr:hypothetical protein [Peribacillus frigoritolerans]
MRHSCRITGLTRPTDACVEETRQTVGGKESGFLKSSEIFKKKLQANAFSSYMSKNKTRVTFMLFTAILIGWRKFATLLPNNWLDETPQTLASRRLGRQSAERERISEIK